MTKQYMMFEKILQPVEKLGELVENCLAALLRRLDSLNIQRFM